MYDRVVDVPRLLSFFDEGDDRFPIPSSSAHQGALEAYYRAN